MRGNHIKSLIYNHFFLNKKKEMTYNINLDFTKKDQKRVLVCYLDFAENNQRIITGAPRTNSYEFMQILKYFINNNYVIDVSNSQGHLYKEQLPYVYDVIFGLGQTFVDAVNMQPNACSVLYMTENPYEISQLKEKERKDYFKDRHKYSSPKTYRTGYAYPKGIELLAKSVITVGEEYYFNHLNVPVERIYDTGFKNPIYEYDYAKKRKNSFLILASTDFIHKGDDLAVELFNKHPDWTLHYCGIGLKNNLKKYRLKISSNVIYHDFVDISSDSFLPIAEECMYILQLSCSEGLSTSVLTGMRHGMIPISFYGNGLDTFSDYAFLMYDYHIESIESVVIEALNLDEKRTKELSSGCFQMSNKLFDLHSYSKLIEEKLKKIGV